VTAFPHPATWLRHRPPALVVDGIEGWDGAVAECRGAPGDWSWSRLLEGAAQTAGIACALEDAAWRGGAIVAEYRDVEVLAERHRGEVRFAAQAERVVLAYRRCRTTATAADGTPLLRALVTLLPDRGPA
jgi:hypothetical protein